VQRDPSVAVIARFIRATQTPQRLQIKLKPEHEWFWITRIRG